MASLEPGRVLRPAAWKDGPPRRGRGATMHVRLTMTGPDTGSIRMAVAKELERADATATWTVEMEAERCLRAEADGQAVLEWRCEVVAWDGRDATPPPHLWPVSDDEDGLIPE